MFDYRWFFRMNGCMRGGLWFKALPLGYELEGLSARVDCVI